jgi:hypothetical protein
MLRQKTRTSFNSRPNANYCQARVDLAQEDETTKEGQPKQDEGALDKPREMSALQRAILAELMPVSPLAIHSEVLLEVLAPFFTAQRKKDRRREFEAAVAPLVQEGIVRYFCCFIDSYAINPRHRSMTPYLADIAKNPPERST